MFGPGLVGLLVLDSWIVDASIARTAAPAPGCEYPECCDGVVFVWVFVFVVCVFAV